MPEEINGVDIIDGKYFGQQRPPPPPPPPLRGGGGGK